MQRLQTAGFVASIDRSLSCLTAGHFWLPGLLDLTMYGTLHGRRHPLCGAYSTVVAILNREPYEHALTRRPHIGHTTAREGIYHVRLLFDSFAVSRRHRYATLWCHGTTIAHALSIVIKPVCYLPVPDEIHPTG
jgi:hypothetical protein